MPMCQPRVEHLWTPAVKPFFNRTHAHACRENRGNPHHRCCDRLSCPHYHSIGHAGGCGEPGRRDVSLDVQETTDSLNESERQTLIDLLAASPTDYASQVSAVLQGEEYPSGCEPAALACVLQSMGVDASLEDVIGYLDIDSEFIDFVYHYAGDPAGDGSAWPQAMVDTANRYLADAEDQAASFVALNISGASFDELKAIMAVGYPVMVWTTTYMEEPEFSDYEIFGYQFVINNHCVVAYGMSNDGENALVMDSLEGLVERDAGDFATIYEERGCLAMAIVPAEASA